MILDSGNRREFDTGAVRDIQEGKGRCDLLPLDVVATLMLGCGEPIEYIYNFTKSGNCKYLQCVLTQYALLCKWDIPTMLLEVSKHFEEGHKKYPPTEDGTPNWKLGIPAHCYIDSAVRHYLKWLRGDTDEDHSRAFVWNIICCIWTCIHKPELNDYAKEGESNANI
jgi:hypothetical protein